MKLILLGKTNSEGFDDPWPIIVPGESKPIPSNKVAEYVNGETLWYYDFYLNTKHSGPPFPAGWTSWPPWVMQLILHFDHAIEQVKNHNERIAYQRINRGRTIT